MEKASKFPQIFFRICFCNDHAGHAQATTAGRAYEINLKSRRVSFAFAFVIQSRENPKSWDIYFFSLVIVSVRMVFLAVSLLECIV